MSKVLNMFREFSVANIDGYEELSDFEKNLFDHTYRKHLSSMLLEDRIHYSENHIVKVERKRIDHDLSVLKIHFTNETFLYFPGNKWVKLS